MVGVAGRKAAGAWLRISALALGVILLTSGAARAQGPDFSNVVSLGDSLLDDGSRRRSPLVPEHITDRLGVGLTQLARGGATTTTLLSQQQHTRAVALGATFAFVWIGGNDFLANQANIAAGNFAFLDTAQANLETALDTLMAGGITDIVFFNLPDLSVVPAVLNGVMALPPQAQPQILANFRAASLDWSRRLQGVAAQRNILLINIFDFTEMVAANPAAFPILGQVGVQAPMSGNVRDCPRCAFADPIHPSSATVGYTTNLTIQRMNEFFGTDIAPLNQAEIDALATDDDADVINNTADNCPLRQNPGQDDFGGLASLADPEGLTPDRIGDACQCGDIDNDGAVTIADALLVFQCTTSQGTCPLQGVNALFLIDRCDVDGQGSSETFGCNVMDALVIARSTLELHDGIGRTCRAMTTR